MNWLASIFVYIILWWVVLFAVLPLGVRHQENPEPGHDPGAPAVTHLKKKLIATTLITFLLWGIGLFVVWHFGLSLSMLQRPD